MASVSKRSPFAPPVRQAPAPAPVVSPKTGVPQGATEVGWLPDYVFTGGKFESGLAFFADAVGRITRFSREPADLESARRLTGQAALPGLVNTHSISWHRVLRGRTEPAPRGGADQVGPWSGLAERALARLSAADIYETARMAFTEMLLSGITCVAEFHALHQQPDGSDWPEPTHAAHQILRAAHELGIRVALLNTAVMRAGYRQPSGSAAPRVRSGSADEFVRRTELLRGEVEKQYAADEAWLGVAADSLATVPLDDFKVVAEYAHSRRMRLHTRLLARPDELAAATAEYGRSPIAVLAQHGIVDKRLTVVHASGATNEEAQLLGAARAILCSCPSTESDRAFASGPIAAMLAAGGGVALGTGSQVQVDLLKEAKLLEYSLRATSGRRPVLGANGSDALLHTATVAGARSLGATSGALEVGRPADFFTVNIYDPSLAGVDADSLLSAVLFSLERRAIRDVWIGARQRIVGGRHADQGPTIGRFVELQKRLWGA